jgi:hypothetical protein
MIRCRLLSLSAVAMNTIHLWTTVEYESNAPYSDAQIINDDALRYNPPGLHAIIELLKKPNTATYVREPLAPGTERINILLTNLRNTTHDPSSTSFEDTVVSWYFELLLCGKYATDTTGVENSIFAAYGVTPPPCPTPHEMLNSNPETW